MDARWFQGYQENSDGTSTLNTDFWYRLDDVSYIGVEGGGLNINQYKFIGMVHLKSTPTRVEITPVFVNQSDAQAAVVTWLDQHGSLFFPQAAAFPTLTVTPA